MNQPEEVPARAVPPGEADPLWFAERAVWTDRMLETLRRGGPEGGKWYWLHDKVFNEQTLRTAFVRVSANGGAPGVDQVTVEQFGERLDDEISRILAAWKAGTFRPQAIRRKWIPKPGSHEERPLGIPTVRDRVVQMALKMVLEPIFEMDFHANSFGFRPGRKAQDALAGMVRHLQAGKVWVVDADLKGYFDTIPHGPLLEAVRSRVTDRKILSLVEQFLKAGILEDGELTESTAGSPQGGVISPLLANLYLNELDHLMARQGRQMLRYADDFVVLCSSQAEAEEALAELQRWTAQAGLVLHPVKTRMVDMGKPGNHVDFLGFRLQRHIDRRGRNRILRLIRPKSEGKIRDSIRTLTPRCCGDSLPMVIGRVNQVLRGWFAYFRSSVKQPHEYVDEFTRRRLRSILNRRRGTPNWGRGDAHRRWPNAYFAELGLFSLKVAHAQYLQSHRGN